ncbi:MAG: YggT family protein [Aggregatilineales bacterium]
MSLEHKEQVREVRGRGYAQRQRVVEVTPNTRTILVSRITMLLWLLTAVLVGLIVFRFALMLMAANPQNGFVDLIYSITDVFVSPFAGIVGSPALDTGSVVDTASIFAAVVYLLGAWAVVSLFRILFAGSRSTRHVTTIEREG